MKRGTACTKADNGINILQLKSRRRWSSNFFHYCVFVLLLFLGISRDASSKTMKCSSYLVEAFQMRQIQKKIRPLTTQSSSSFFSLAAISNNNGGDDAKGAAILLNDISVYRGPNEILKEISWRIEPKQKWALVGSNGCGKSTLLKAIMNEIPYELGGKISIGNNQNVGYLQQTAVSGSTKTIYDEAISAMTDIENAKQKLQYAQKQLELATSTKNEEHNNNSNEDVDNITRLVKQLDLATERFERVGGYQQEQEVSTILHGLGFTNLQQKCDELSGGWQMRVSFAKLLLSKPSLCLLDEPGNHLDRNARKWLAQYLANYEYGAMILVTHDIELLSSMDHIAEIVDGTIQIYKSCKYDQYLELKQQRAIAAQTQYESNKQKAAKLQAFVDKYGASATKASAAQSRVKQIQKMEKSGLLDAPPMAITQEERYKPILNLPEPPKAIGDILLSLTNNAAVGYSNSCEDLKGESNVGELLVSNIKLDIRRGMKLLIRGPNGCGKSTILHTLRGTLPLLNGDRIINESLRLGVFTQDLAQELDPTARGVDLVTAYARGGSDDKNGDDGGNIFISENDARTVMGGLGLKGDKALRQIHELSGGEKARVALAMFALKPSNVYLLDEVSNHLDVECVEALSDALAEWGDDTGAIVVISHDKSFCEKIQFTHVATVEDGRLSVEQRDSKQRDWDTSISSKQQQPTLGVAVEGNGFSNSNNDDTVTTTATSSTSIDDVALRKQRYNAPKRISKLETMITKKEEKISHIDNDMMNYGNDMGKLMDLTKEKEQLEMEVMELMEEWEELEELLQT